LVLRYIAFVVPIILSNFVPRNKHANLKKIVLLLIITLFTIRVSAQLQQQWNWYFGNHAAINFSSGSPVAVIGSAMVPFEGCNTISDSVGNLLFYTTYPSVWNRNNLVMPNGNGMDEGFSTTQSSVIVPKPDSSNIYYIFTNEGWLYYSEVDMTLDGGLGDVTVKNFHLLDSIDERLTAVRHCNGKDFWVICHNSQGNTFIVYLISNAGISSPIVFNVGQSLQYNIGYTKASPNGQKLVAAEYGHGTEIFDFDNSTGSISNPISIPSPNTDTTGFYGSSFSPDNNKIYLAGQNHICQYDISSNNQATIIASLYHVDTAFQFGTLQIGPDQKIYLDGTNSHYLAVINNPNVAGPGCNLVDNAVYLGGNACGSALPNFIDAYYSPGQRTHVTVDTIYCAYSFTLYPTVTGTSYLWSTGATTETIPISSNGTYWVQIQGAAGCNVQVNFMDTFNIIMYPPVTVSLGQDTTFCNGNTLVINANNSNGNLFLWSTGATSQTIIVSSTGSYIVTVTSNQGCTATADQNVTVNPNPVPIITGDSVFCSIDSSLLDAGSFPHYHWSTGSTNETITVNTTNTYIVTVTNGFGCTGTALKAVTVNPYAQADFVTYDTIGCTPYNVNYVNLSTNANSYLWYFGNSDSSIYTSPSYVYHTSGLYTVTLIAYGAGGCNDTLVHSDYITVGSNVDTIHQSFTMSPTSGCDSLTVHFQNTTFAGTYWLWNFAMVILILCKALFILMILPGFFMSSLVDIIIHFVERSIHSRFMDGILSMPCQSADLLRPIIADVFLIPFNLIILLPMQILTFGTSVTRHQVPPPQILPIYSPHQDMILSH
jgi:PKD repeat protein